MSTTVTWTLSPMMIDSSRCLESTNIRGSFLGYADAWLYKKSGRVGPHRSCGACRVTDAGA
jgi:hypothetical protein